MKQFLIGDGHKRISCPDAYLADMEDTETTVIWHPEYHEIPIRASVLTIVPKDPERRDVGLWTVIDAARERGVQPVAEGSVVYFGEREVSDEPDTIMHFYRVGTGVHLGHFSIAVSVAAEATPEFAMIHSDLIGMIRSMTVRGDEEQFTGHLLESQLEQIEAAAAKLIGVAGADDPWLALQSHLDRAYAEADEGLARRVGLAFGESLRAELPTLHWSVKSDDYGTGLALDLANTTISIFPEDMILKRFDCREVLKLRDFVNATIERIDDLFREMQR